MSAWASQITVTRSFVRKCVQLEYGRLQDTCDKCHGVSSAFKWDDNSLDITRRLTMRPTNDDQHCLEFNPVFNWRRVKRNECRSNATIFHQIGNQAGRCVS